MQLFPILQKEYNLDGTKKSVVELVRNMKQEISDLTQSNSSNRETLIQDSKEMYYELIYRKLEKSSQKQLEEYTKKIGKTTFLQILQEIDQYFDKDEQTRIEKTAKMNEAYNKMGKYTTPYNNETIKVEQDGKVLDMNAQEFIQTLSPDLVNKKFAINGPMSSTDQKALITGEQYIKEHLFQYISKTGKVHLKDGRSYTAKQYIEELFNSSQKLDTFSLLWKVKREFKSVDYTEEQKDFEERMHKYYLEKHKFIKEVMDRVLTPENYQENPFARIYNHQQVAIQEIKSTTELGKETLTEQKDTVLLDEIERVKKNQGKALEIQRETSENGQNR